MKSDYQKQAQDFADRIGLEMTAVYTGHRARFGIHITAVYSITLTRKGRSYTFDFSTSINDSWKYNYNTKGLPPKIDIDKFFKSDMCHQEQFTYRDVTVRRCKIPPTMYDILACLTKSDPGSFKDFCGDFGYGEDSRKDLETYIAVQKEWENVNNLFHDVLTELEEIN